MARPLQHPELCDLQPGDFVLIRGDKYFTKNVNRWARRNGIKLTASKHSEPAEVVADLGALYRVERTE
mgnify:CR=1 FL=1